MPEPNIDLSSLKQQGVSSVSNNETLLAKLDKSLKDNSDFKEQVYLSLDGIYAILKAFEHIEVFKNLEKTSQNVSLDFNALKAKIKEYESYLRELNASLGPNIEVLENSYNGVSEKINELQSDLEKERQRLENALNAELENLKTHKTEELQTEINTHKQEILKALNSLKELLSNALNDQKTNALNELTNKTSESLESLKNSQSTALSEINSNKENAINAITQDKASVLSELELKESELSQSLTEEVENAKLALNEKLEQSKTELNHLNSGLNDKVERLEREVTTTKESIKRANDNAGNALKKSNNAIADAQNATNQANNALRNANEAKEQARLAKLSAESIDKSSQIKVLSRVINSDFQERSYYNIGDDFEHLFYLADSQNLETPLFEANKKYLVEVWLPYSLCFRASNGNDSYIILASSNSPSDIQVLSASLRTLLNSEVFMDAIGGNKFYIFSHYYAKFIYKPTKDYTQLGVMGCKIFGVTFCPNQYKKKSTDYGYYDFNLTPPNLSALNPYDSLITTSILEEGYFTLTELNEEPSFMEVVNGKIHKRENKR